MTINDEMKKISNIVCQCCGISEDDLVGLSRKQNLTEAREMFATFSKRFCGADRAEISRYLNRHHTTITNSLLKFEYDYVYNERFRMKANEIENYLKNNEAQEHSNA